MTIFKISNLMWEKSLRRPFTTKRVDEPRTFLPHLPTMKASQGRSYKSRRLASPNQSHSGEEEEGSSKALEPKQSTPRMRLLVRRKKKKKRLMSLHLTMEVHQPLPPMIIQLSLSRRWMHFGMSIKSFK